MITYVSHLIEEAAIMLSRPSLCITPAGSQVPVSNSGSMELYHSSFPLVSCTVCGAINHASKPMWFLPFLMLCQRSARGVGISAMVMSIAHNNNQALCIFLGRVTVSPTDAIGIVPLLHRLLLFLLVLFLYFFSPSLPPSV